MICREHKEVKRRGNLKYQHPYLGVLTFNMTRFICLECGYESLDLKQCGVLQKKREKEEAKYPFSVEEPRIREFTVLKNGKYFCSSTDLQNCWEICRIMNKIV